MQFTPFKGLKKTTVTLNSITPNSTIFTTTRDSLIFFNVYNTNASFGFSDSGFIYYQTSGTVFNRFNYRVLWRAIDFTPDPIDSQGQRCKATFVPAGENIRQSGIFLAGQVKIDIFVLELQDEIVPTGG